jgi:hypothetical protein
MRALLEIVIVILGVCILLWLYKKLNKIDQDCERLIDYTLTRCNPDLLDPDDYVRIFRERLIRIPYDHPNINDILKTLKSFYKLDKETYAELVSLDSETLINFYKTHLMLQDLHKKGIKNPGYLMPEDVKLYINKCETTTIDISKFFDFFGRDRIIKIYSSLDNNGNHTQNVKSKDSHISPTFN